MNIQLRRSFCLLIVGLLTACSRNGFVYSTSYGPVTDEIISHIEESNPIIVVPGIGGSSLVDISNGKPAWGSYGYTSYWPATEKDNKLLAFPWVNEDDESGKNRYKVKPFSMLNKVAINLIPFVSVDLAIYSTIVKSLEKSGYVRYKNMFKSDLSESGSKPPLFEFAYDWRKSNADNAKELHRFVEAKSNALQSQKSNFGNRKFNIVCHSMGCLVARYYLRYGEQGLGSESTPPNLDWRGSHRIENIIMVAPPNRGSIEALTNLVEGFHPHKIKWLKYPPAVLGTMPSMYELLASKDIIDVSNQNGERLSLLDPSLWQTMNWGLSDPTQKSILNQIASEITTNQNPSAQAKILQAKLLHQAKLFHSRLDLESKSPSGLGFYLFAGLGQPTGAGLVVNTETKTWSVKRSNAGDGAVLRASAYAIKNTEKPDEGSIIPWDNVIYFNSDHMNLVQNNDFFANLYDVLIWREKL